MARTIARQTLITLASLLLSAFPAADALADADSASPYFRITVVDEDTGRGVPLVELRTVSNVRYFTDSTGVIAFHEPGLMDREVFFFVESHGYEYPADGFGTRGVRLRPTAGGSATLEIKRLNIAERLYRITGEGIYRDSVLLGDTPPIQEPLLNAKVVGQDGGLAIPYRGRIYWFWGDTAKPSYPLGNFAMSGATAEPPGEGGLDPAEGVDLAYFVGEDGFSRPMVDLPEPGIVWLDGLMTIEDDEGRERLVARYERLRRLGETLGQGLVIFNDETETFERLASFELDSPFGPRGWSPFRLDVEGADYFYFPYPYPTLRVPATLEAIRDPERYEAYTPLAPGAGYEGADARLDRDDDDRLRWAWKRGTAPLSPAEQEEVIDAGLMERDETPFRLANADTGEPIEAHRGSVRWNEYRGRWVMIVGQIGGDASHLGEIWYAEAPSPEGPWERAVKVVTHDRYSFYNPVHHGFFDQAGGRYIYFEGTYTRMFSGSENPTPRYDYNQVMYRLDLADERLGLERRAGDRAP